MPLLSPWLSSHWIGLVTPVDTGVARPLVESLAVETVVTDPSGQELFDVRADAGARGAALAVDRGALSTPDIGLNRSQLRSAPRQRGSDGAMIR